MVQYLEDKALIKSENHTKVRRIINSTERRIQKVLVVLWGYFGSDKVRLNLKEKQINK